MIDRAKRLEPSLGAREFADAGQRLDGLADEVFARYGLGPEDVAVIRERFTAGPR